MSPSAYSSAVLMLVITSLSGLTAHATTETERQIAERYSLLEKAVLNESNTIRQTPADYIPLLEERRRHIKNGVYYKPGSGYGIQTVEGISAVIEAEKALQEQPALNSLIWDDALAQIARMHMEDTGPKGLVGHKGSDNKGLSERLANLNSRKTYRAFAESISYGHDNGTDVVLQLHIDDGVKNRGHRKSLFSDAYSHAGVSCGTHKTYSSMCVIVYGAKRSPTSN